MTGEQIIIRMNEEIRRGDPVEDVVDRHVDCATPELRQLLIDGIRKMVGNEMIEKALAI